MASFQKFNPFIAALANKVHNLATDQLMVALCAAANPPASANAVLADLTQISYTNCSSRVITTTSSTQSGGLYKLILQDLTLSASGGNVGPYRYVVVYNNTATNKDLIGFYDRGADSTLLDGDSQILDLDQTNGLFNLGP